VEPHVFLRDLRNRIRFIQRLKALGAEIGRETWNNWVACFILSSLFNWCIAVFSLTTLKHLAEFRLFLSFSPCLFIACFDRFSLSLRLPKLRYTHKLLPLPTLYITDIFLINLFNRGNQGHYRYINSFFPFSFILDPLHIVNWFILFFWSTKLSQPDRLLLSSSLFESDNEHIPRLFNLSFGQRHSKRQQLLFVLSFHITYIFAHLSLISSFFADRWTWDWRIGSSSSSLSMWFTDCQLVYSLFIDSFEIHTSLRALSSVFYQLHICFAYCIFLIDEI
jgi:hypothetical protein